MGVKLSARISSYQGKGGTHRDGQVVNAGKLGDLANVSEGSAHDDGLVAELLVVVKDGLDGLDTGVVLLGGGLVPVKDTTNEGGDEESASLGGSNGLDGGEEESEVAVDVVVALQNLGGLDTLPRRGDLDQDTVLGDTLLLVQLKRGHVSTALLLTLPRRLGRLPGPRRAG